MTSLHVESTLDIAQPWLHFFLYGDTGSGKTTAAATMPSPLFLVPASEGSELTLRGKDVDYVKIGRNAEGAPVDVRNHMNGVLTDLEKRAAHYFAGDQDALPWETVVVESLTHYCDMLVASISEDGRKQMDMQKWGLVATHLQHIHSRLRRLPVHVVFTALAQLKENDGKQVVGMPAIQGSMATKLPSACDIIGYAEELPPSRGAETPTYRIHFTKSGPYLARARFAGFPRFVDNFTFAQVAPFCGLT